MRISTALCASLLLALTAAAPAGAVDEGVIDGAGHPNVGLMGVDFDGAAGAEPPTPWCSGSVVSDHVFLTAGHCLVGLPPESEFYVTLAAGTPAAPVMPPAVYPDEFPFTFNVPLIRAIGGVVHPKWKVEPREHDIAVVLFEPGTFSGVTPVELPREGLLDRISRKQPIRLVGYGADPERGNGASQFIVEGYRQTRITQFRYLTRQQLVMSGGLCHGDSGGPQLLGDSNLAVSLVAEVGDDCELARGQRLDTRDERRFLARYL